MPKARYTGDERNDAYGAEKEHKEVTESMWKRIWNALFLNKAGMWAAIFTGILTLFTYELYQVADQTNRTTVATQRAYLNFQNILGGVYFHSPGSNERTAIQVGIIWNNSGATPATNVIAMTTYKSWPSELPPGFDFPDDSSSPKFPPIAIGPKDSQGMAIVVPIGDIKLAWEGKARLYFWGWVMYDDIFPGDARRLTEYCAEMTQITIPTGKEFTDPSTQIQWIARQCGRHSCYDEHCPDYQSKIKSTQAVTAY